MSIKAIFSDVHKYKIITIFMISILLTGCVNTNISVQDMLAPPKLPVQLEDIKTVIDDVYSDEIEYINPLNGENKDSIQFVDLDGDGIDEVLLFNRVKDSNNPLRVLLLSKKDGKWISNDRIKGVGFGISKVLYEDMDFDGTKEIFIGWQGGSNNKGLSIYQYEKGKLVNVFEGLYTEFCVGDLTGDGKQELMLVNLDQSEGIAIATMYDCQFFYIDEVEMEGFIKGYYDVKIGLASEDKNGFFIDALYGDGTSFTDLIIYDDGLKNVFYDYKWKRIDKTYKPIAISSNDIDKDGLIEIARLRKAFGYHNVDDNKSQWITTWYNWDNNSGLLFNSESYKNNFLGFELLFPNKWKQNITVDILGDESNIVVFSYVDAYSKECMPILQIKAISRIDKKDNDINPSNGINNGIDNEIIQKRDTNDISGKCATSEFVTKETEIARNIDYIYYATQFYNENDNNNVKISLNDIKKRFRLLGDYVTDKEV